MALVAKQYGVNNIVAKISRASYSQIIERLGIDVALNPSILPPAISLSLYGAESCCRLPIVAGQAEV